jgi:cytochrome c-type biogenesis protein
MSDAPVGWANIVVCKSLAVRLCRIASAKRLMVAVGWLENLKHFARYRRGFEIAGGVLLIAMGFYMLNAVYIWIPELAV